jgi:NAD(P)-dependent dehydrogenase (short-subunit alcohol dehydrogenase family)
MADRFAGKSGLVTGAGGGIGRATAIAFAREGARVACADIDVAGGEETVALIQDAGGDACFIATDVSRTADVKAAVDFAVERLGRLDFAHNNAGIDGQFTPIATCSEENFDHVIGVNLKSVWAGLKYEIPVMAGQGSGAIVNTGSTASLFGYRTMAHYVASKHGVAGLTKAAALECSLTGVRVNCVCPGVIATRMISDFVKDVPEIREAMTSMQPVNRMGAAEEIAATVLWLCSDEASFVTGAIISADGGVAAQSGAFPPMPE